MIPPYQYFSPTQQCQQSERNCVCVYVLGSVICISLCVWKTSLVPRLFFCGWGMCKSILYWVEVLFCVLQGILGSTVWWCGGCFKAWDVCQDQDTDHFESVLDVISQHNSQSFLVFSECCEGYARAHWSRILWRL